MYNQTFLAYVFLISSFKSVQISNFTNFRKQLVKVANKTLCIFFLIFFMLIIQTYLSIFFNFNSSNLSFSYDYGSLDTSTMCRYLPFYLRRHTNMNCTDNMLTMEIYYNASLWANYYCQKDFEMRPWNCSSDRRYIRKLTDHCKLRIDLLSKAVNAVKS